LISVTLIRTVAGTLLLVLPALVATAVVWTGLRDLLQLHAPGAVIVVGTLLLVTVWATGLLMAGLAAAWRSFAWTASWIAATPAHRDHRGG
jgi:hypothetical protein